MTEQTVDQSAPETIHACPPDGSGLMPCCGKTPFELPRSDRMTANPAAVTCTPAAPAPTTVCSMPRFMTCNCGHIDGCQYPATDDPKDRS